MRAVHLLHMQPEVRAAGGAVRQLVVLRVGAADQDLIPGARDKGERRALRRFFLFGIARLAQIPGRTQLGADVSEVALALGARKLIEHAVKGMLPKNRLGAKLLRNLKVYKDENHEQEAQQPKKIDLNEIY